ncbi:uncharacterized protein EV420DRAFT_1753614 [Desarmillaria tabescens]|uniref:Uncharacterized protein n=1 Tax=Armillaria tabescens TaxID=1929756 RepID=A0AA39MJB4_ARMTA|nr:uncharacterized protein EV420DRAFT_1753614 [Desarmillaria tabescens]KAK0436981.1 hypothetical protein EV420DRAFT_1753614 [Desarmillaria tabescens]
MSRTRDVTFPRPAPLYLTSFIHNHPAAHLWLSSILEVRVQYYRDIQTCQRVTTIAELRQTCGPLLSSEQDVFTDLTVSGESYFAGIEKKIVITRQLLHFLPAEKDLSHMKTLAHPVRQLPDDVWNESFSYWASAFDHCKDEFFVSGIQPATTLITAFQPPTGFHSQTSLDLLYGTLICITKK